MGRARARYASRLSVPTAMERSTDRERYAEKQREQAQASPPTRPHSWRCAVSATRPVPSAGPAHGGEGFELGVIHTATPTQISWTTERTRPRAGRRCGQPGCGSRPRSSNRPGRPEPQHDPERREREGEGDRAQPRVRSEQREGDLAEAARGSWPWVAATSDVRRSRLAQNVLTTSTTTAALKNAVRWRDREPSSSSPAGSTARNASATTTVGRTKGTTTSARATLRAAERNRPRTYAGKSDRRTAARTRGPARMEPDDVSRQRVREDIERRSEQPSARRPRSRIEARGYAKKSANVSGMAYVAVRQPRGVGPHGSTPSSARRCPSTPPRRSRLASISSGGSSSGRRHDRVFHELTWELRLAVDGKDEHRERSILLEALREHEVDELSSALLVASSKDLTNSIRMGTNPRSRSSGTVGRGFRKITSATGSMSRRRRSAGCLAAGRAGELHRVRLLPAVDHEDAVRSRSLQ